MKSKGSPKSTRNAGLFSRGGCSAEPRTCAYPPRGGAHDRQTLPDRLGGAGPSLIAGGPASAARPAIRAAGHQKPRPHASLERLNQPLSALRGQGLRPAGNHAGRRTTMSHLDLLRTIHCPVSADGKTVKNSFGIVVATATDEPRAAAIAELINLGVEAAEKLNADYDRREQKIGEMVRNNR